MFEVEGNEIKFLYNSNKMGDRETLAYVKSLHQHVINELDVYQNDMTPTQISELANKLEVRIIDLFDRESAYFREQIEGKDVQEKDLLNILQKEKECLNTPILISKHVSKMLDSSAETISLDMVFKNIPPSDETKNQ
ncbi:hypothetical protein KIH41_05240 [Litoribacter ruber]|uniref:Uncharacterized protein n=1 Tax=Litoribacter ruber TaxID=702568 RepID=A0AAP2CEW6_9BACT|nr:MULTISPECIES: hypothetical protein [Litoribacter]MBS9523158.1 hypothetical protein [Litoribacter alkaliphilus]MBT0810679.1 hypothetical protein [Litoribacter ruber]